MSHERRDEPPSHPPPMSMRPLRFLGYAVFALGMIAVGTALSLIVGLEGQIEVPETLARSGRVHGYMTEVQDQAEDLHRSVGGYARATARAQLSQSISRAQRAHREMMQSPENNPVMLLRDARQATSAAAALDHTTDQLRAAHEMLVSGEETLPDGRDLPRYIKALARQYLITLENIDLQAALATEKRLASMQSIEGVVVVLCGLLLMGTAFFAIRRVARTIDRYVREFGRANRELRDNRALLAEAVVAAGHLSEERRRLLRAVSHDIRAPLQSAVLAAQMAEYKPQEARRYLDRVAQNARRVSEIVGDAAAYNGSIVTETVDVGDVVESVCASFASQAERKGLLLAAHTDGPLCATADSAALYRVLENLVGNAVKYTERGEVHVRVRPHADQICIEVQDTGSGIPPEELDAIFTLGHRVRHDVEGEGVGLALARELTRHRLGGLIDVRSELGKGSVFTLVLPLHRAGVTAPPDFHPEAVLERLERAQAFADMRVILIGAPTVGTILAQAGTQVIRGDANPAATLARNPSAALLVLDVDEVSPADELHLLQVLHSLGENAPLLIVVGQHPRDSKLHPELREKASRWVTKPVLVQEVLSWLVETLPRSPAAVSEERRSSTEPCGASASLH